MIITSVASKKKTHCYHKTLYLYALSSYMKWFEKYSNAH